MDLIPAFRKLSLVALLACGSASRAAPAATALDDYVAAPDPSFTWRVVSTAPGTGYTSHILEVTSQSWRSGAEVDRPLWKHWLAVAIPDTVTSTMAFLWIGGGSNGGSPPTSAPQMARDIALQTGTVAAEIRMVPNQPLVFAGDGRSRSEDEIIAYTFDRYLVTGDGTWPALLPMVKSAVRAMDTIAAYVPEATGGVAAVERFVVGGASKRGWTTWLTAAVDPRVAGIVPVVIDVLDLDRQMAHHHDVYEGITARTVGGYSDAIHDYVDMNVIARMDTPEGQDLLRIVDPYEYRDRFTMPKYLLCSTGDQFFVPDSSRFYYGDLPGPKCLRYVPNTDHSLGGSALGSALAFYSSLLAGATLPEVTWTVERGATIRAETSGSPSQVRLWRAANPASRDFRLDTTGAIWTSAPLAPEGGAYAGSIEFPETGYAAFTLEFQFPTGGASPIVLTTEVSVIGPAGGRIRGDCNGDGSLDISDPVCLLFLLFAGSAAGPGCGDGTLAHPGNLFVVDANGDGAADVTDAVSLLAHLFLDGPLPQPEGCTPVEGCPEVCSP
jgi:PhoPQ-activated pathogenicity-related protein